MTSPVSAVEAIEKAMEGVTRLDAPEWIAVDQDGNGPNGGFWTCAAATTESPRYIRADIYAALARQAEALQRENAELREANRRHATIVQSLSARCGELERAMEKAEQQIDYGQVDAAHQIILCALSRRATGGDHG